MATTEELQVPLTTDPSIQQGWAPVVGSTTICSIVPWTVVTKEYTWGGWPHSFTIPGVGTLEWPNRDGRIVKHPTSGIEELWVEARGRKTIYAILSWTPRYRLLKIFDSGEIRLNLANIDDHERLWFPKPSWEMAGDIVQEIAGNQIANASGFTVGFRIIKGDKPSEEELTQLEYAQTENLRYLVRDADSLYLVPAQRHRIGISHRRALEALVAMGRDTFDAHQVPNGWYITSGDRILDTKKCYACGETIAGAAKVCKICQINLVKWFVEMGGQPPDTDPELLKEVQVQRGRMAAKKTM